MKAKLSREIQRRDFVKIVLGTIGSLMGITLGFPLVGYLVSPALKQDTSTSRVALGPIDKYPIGAPTLFTFTRTKTNGWEKTVTSYGVYVLRKGENEVKVFSNICTHLGCRVNWKPDIQEYVSPCHDGHFAMDGAVTKGPPPRPLDQYETEIEQGQLYITLVG